MQAKLDVKDVFSLVLGLVPAADRELAHSALEAALGAMQEQPEPVRYTIKLHLDPGSNKIACIAMTRAFTPMGLKEAKETIERHIDNVEPLFLGASAEDLADALVRTPKLFEKVQVEVTKIPLLE